ncbi:MAG: hypothetical protein ISS63_01650 [Desulfobacteraceae bacterium]|nr:hypothetical protein [Desulfobacteraceae bacterium]
MEDPKDGIRAKREIILAFRLPLILDLGLYIGYYFRVKFGAWRYIYGKRYPKEILNQYQSNYHPQRRCLVFDGPGRYADLSV